MTGEWGCREFGGLETELAAVDLQAARRVSIDAGALTKLDLTGAWALHQFVARARAAGAAVSFKGSAPDQLRLLDDTLQEAEKGVEERPAAPAPRARHRAFMQLLVDLGRHTAGSAATNRGPGVPRPHQRHFIASVPRPKHLRVTSIVRHVYETGITALPIVALIAFLISVIIAYMSAQQLSGLGAECTSSTSSRSACCASSACCSPRSSSPAAPAAPTPPELGS